MAISIWPYINMFARDSSLALYRLTSLALVLACSAAVLWLIFLSCSVQANPFPLATNRTPPVGMPSVAFGTNGEIAGMTDVQHLMIHGKDGHPLVPDWKQHELRRAYYAATTFMDAQIGRVGINTRVLVRLWYFCSSIFGSFSVVLQYGTGTRRSGVVERAQPHRFHHYRTFEQTQHRSDRDPLGVRTQLGSFNCIRLTKLGVV